jgi:hypothetical protein
LNDKIGEKLIEKMQKEYATFWLSTQLHSLFGSI